MSEEEPSKMFKITSWNTVAMWAFNNTCDTCAICRSTIREPCIKCQANQESLDQSQCKKVIGACNHAFHVHCITEWTKQQNRCAICFKEWVQMKFLE